MEGDFRNIIVQPAMLYRIERERGGAIESERERERERERKSDRERGGDRERERNSERERVSVASSHVKRL